jgi:proline dehydrogenase
MRTVLLAASESPWLRRKAPRLRFVRKAVARFMPGERVEDALAAASALGRQGLASLLTCLGENVTVPEEADRVTGHYSDVLARIAASGLDGEISVKLTQLGLDIDPARCLKNLRALVERARTQRAWIWIDMEQHTYVDVTLELYRRVLAEYPNVGVCLQVYLYRTAGDLQNLMPLGGGVRLVKGAYREPADVAYPRKRDVDANFLALARQMLAAEVRAVGFRPVFGTHDRRLIGAIQAHAAASGVEKESFEFALLFGIQRGEQIRLAQEGHRVRVLISYGEHWFPWYMRRLAERPANVLFVARALFS